MLRRHSFPPVPAQRRRASFAIAARGTQQPTPESVSGDYQQRADKKEFDHC